MTTTRFIKFLDDLTLVHDRWMSKSRTIVRRMLLGRSLEPCLATTPNLHPLPSTRFGNPPQPNVSSGVNHMNTISKRPGQQRTFVCAGHRSHSASARFFLPILTLFAVLGWQQSAQAALVNKDIIAFTGVLDAIEFPIAGIGLVNTGPITVSLDPAGQNVFGLDDSTATGAIDVTLIVDFPLLANIMEPQPSINIIENGAASITAGGSHDFIFDANMTGGGTIMSGLLTGVQFSNTNAYNGEGFFSSWEAISPPDITWEVMNGQVIFPAELTGGSSDFIVTGVGGIGTLTVVPEPGTFALGIIGLLSVMAFGRLARREIRRIRSG